MSGIGGISVNPIYLPPSWGLYRDEGPSGGPFDKAFDVLGKQMEHLSEQANDYYKALQAKTALSKEAEKHLAALEKLLAQVGGSDKEVELDSGTIAFLEKNVALPEGWGKWGGKYSGEDLLKAKQQLQAFNTAQTDFVAESQLKIQRIMQTYNTTATLLNSLQSMLSEINKSIIQGFR